MTTAIVINEEVRRLLEKLDDLKRQSSRLWEKKDDLLTFEKPHLYSLYQTMIGILQYDEYALKTELSRLRRKADLLQAAINRNDRIDETAIEKQLDDEYEEFKTVLQGHLNSIKAAKEFLESPGLSQDEVKELSSDYRLIAKKLHPDINPNATEAQKELFVKAIAAYKSCDLNTLRQIVLTLDTNTVENLPVETLEEQIEKLKGIVETYKKQIASIEEEFPFDYRDRLYDKEWVMKTQDEIQARVEELKKQIEQQKQYVQILKLWKPESLS